MASRAEIQSRIRDGICGYLKGEVNVEHKIREKW